jgi:catechol 2,3-dioxygenase-like lactoylglutathione lyase family enzyme
MKTVNIISVPVTDQQRAKEFYQKMGLSVVTEAPMGNDQTWVQMAFPAGGANITLVNWFTQMPAGSFHGTTIPTDDIEADRERLQKVGIASSPTDNTPWGKFSSVSDLDGNSWILHQE